MSENNLLPETSGLCECCDVPPWGFCLETKSVTDNTQTPFFGISGEDRYGGCNEFFEQFYSNSNRFFSSVTTTVTTDTATSGFCGDPEPVEIGGSTTTEIMPDGEQEYEYHPIICSGTTIPLQCLPVFFPSGFPENEKQYAKKFTSPTTGEIFGVGGGVTFNALELGPNERDVTCGEFDFYGLNVETSVEGSTVVDQFVYRPWDGPDAEYCDGYNGFVVGEYRSTYSGELSDEDIIDFQKSNLSEAEYPSAWSRCCSTFLNGGQSGFGHTVMAIGGWGNYLAKDSDGSLQEWWTFGTPYNPEYSYKVASFSKKSKVRFRIRTPHTCYCKIWVSQYEYKYYFDPDLEETVFHYINVEEPEAVEITIPQTDGLCFSGFPENFDCNESYLKTAVSEEFELNPTEIEEIHLDEKGSPELVSIKGICLAGYSLIDGWEPPFFRLSDEKIQCEGLPHPYWMPESPSFSLPSTNPDSVFKLLGYPLKPNDLSAIQEYFDTVVNVCVP
jgi:hypothetical protein